MTGRAPKAKLLRDVIPGDVILVDGQPVKVTGGESTRDGRGVSYKGRTKSGMLVGGDDRLLTWLSHE